jgi:hypothetical protein
MYPHDRIILSKFPRKIKKLRFIELFDGCSGAAAPMLPPKEKRLRPWWIDKFCFQQSNN